MSGRSTKRAPWGHVSRRCVLCSKVGPRVSFRGGYAHRYCINKLPKAERQR